MIAVRGISTESAGAAAVRQDMRRERLLIALGMSMLVLLAIGLRLEPTILSPSINWGDEIFQTVEPAHRLVYGYGLVTWEFQV
ncbi:MAG: hypothetical protein ACREFC_05785, partial [Stellaceae bacterium]